MIGVLGNKDARLGFFILGRGAPQPASGPNVAPGAGGDVRHSTVDQPDSNPNLIPGQDAIQLNKARVDMADTDQGRPAADLTAEDLDKTRPPIAQ